MTDKQQPMTTEEVKNATMSDTAFLLAYGLDITNNDPEDNPADELLIPPKHRQFLENKAAELGYTHGPAIGETIFVQGRAYSVLYELDAESGSYAVWFPDLEECYTSGDTLANARAMAMERLEIYLDDQGNS